MCVVRIVFVLDFVIDLSIDQVRKQPGVKEFPSAGRDDSSILIEIHVAGDDGADFQDHIFRGGDQ